MSDKKIILVRPTSGHKPIKVTIDPEFATLCPPLDAAEYAQLEASIRANNGVPRDAIIVWESPEKELILLDGHTRVSIIEKQNAEESYDAGINCDVEVIRQEFLRLPTRADALLWMEENQVSRRNLTDDQRAIIWDSIRERRSAIAKTDRAVKARAAQEESRLSSETDEKPKPEPASTKQDTRKDIAKESGLPENKFKTVAKLKKTAPEKIAAVRSGKTTLREAAKESKPEEPKKPAASSSAKWWTKLADDFDDVLTGFAAAPFHPLEEGSEGAARSILDNIGRITSGSHGKDHTVSVKHQLRNFLNGKPSLPAPKTAPVSANGHHRLPPYVYEIARILLRNDSSTVLAVRKYTEIAVRTPDGHVRTGEGESYQSEGMARSALKGMMRQNSQWKNEKDFAVVTNSRWKVVSVCNGDDWTLENRFPSKADAEGVVAFVKREWELREADQAVAVPAPKKAAKPAVNATEEDLDFVRGKS